MDHFKWKSNPWKLCSNEKCTLVPTLGAWCLSKRRAMAVLWHFIKYFVLIPVTWGILQNLLFGSLLNLFKYIRKIVKIKCEFVAKFIVQFSGSGLHNEIDSWHKQLKCGRGLQMPQTIFRSCLLSVLSCFFVELNSHPENHLSWQYLNLVYLSHWKFEWNNLC